MEPRNDHRYHTVHGSLPVGTHLAEEAPAYSIQDKYYPPSDLPPTQVRDSPFHEMDTLHDRILMKRHLENERSKRNKSFVTIVVLSLALGLCLVGLAVFFILYETKRCPAATDPTPTVKVIRQGPGVRTTSEEAEDSSDDISTEGTVTTTSMSTNV